MQQLNLGNKPYHYTSFTFHHYWILPILFIMQMIPMNDLTQSNIVTSCITSMGFNLINSIQWVRFSKSVNKPNSKHSRLQKVAKNKLKFIVFRHFNHFSLTCHKIVSDSTHILLKTSSSAVPTQAMYFMVVEWQETKKVFMNKI